MSDQTEVLSDVANKHPEPMVMCAGCEEDIAVPGEPYCPFCGQVKSSLEEIYQQRPVVRPVSLFSAQPREDLGVEGLGVEDIGIEELERRTRPIEALHGDATIAKQCLAGLAVSAFAFVVSCLMGWYGLRLLVALGVWAVSR